jgi:hypothetical protein
MRLFPLPALINTMRKSILTRRQFLILSGAATAAALVNVGCEGGGEPGGTRTVYRLSLRGRRGSNAAKTHNANKLFRTMEAADTNRAHPEDNSRIVSIIVGSAMFKIFFKGDATVADLRDF